MYYPEIIIKPAELKSHPAILIAAVVIELKYNVTKVPGLELQIDALAASLQKVSAQLELNGRAPETVSNNQ